MKVKFADLKTQYLSLKSEIDSAILGVIDELAFVGGKYPKKFEEDFKALYKVPECVSVANGTDAIYITLKMLGIGIGDEVITTASSWISTSETISQTGAKPVFVDIDEYYTIDPIKIESAITKKTKAIIPVHLYGQAADMESIMKIAKEHKLFVVEDCAQSHFSMLNGKYVGTFGDASTFSFYPGKNLGAYGDAGCILTSNSSLSNKFRMYANHGALKKHEHLMEGINSRLDGIQAAVLSVKLPHLSSWNLKRNNNAMIYNSLLKDLNSVQIPKVRANSFHSFHLYVIRVKERNELVSYLSSKGIETAIHYPTPLPLLPAYSHLNTDLSLIPNSIKHHKEIISLPMYPELDSTSIAYVVDCIKEFYKSK
ncbi:DegT/DnrJ/EryC1/StrS family aminotransferase [Sandaracinomonas limnophila]|uniref:DegT/DnrJ/EryC1/StrS family aminotransferase n=1 Tax=Sandaracinomonas limnophila TaxID=1862386 RepID=A0A437PTN9_9BACT|nr:DegT/DnrJ/EryC1/StrS family aminotransferase [Sandaracinomonas limnophila]RVU25597.1 DegT/DnrJ/EryC1/StrS family aminotransferase [Sandaracinomonas limnophila]